MGVRQRFGSDDARTRTRPGIVVRIRSSIGVLALCVLAGAAAADQDAPALDGLFDQLSIASSGSDATRIEARIWQLWLEPPDDESGSLLASIESAMRIGDLDLALALCDELVERQPDFAEGWNKRATVRYLAGDHDGSVADIQRTVELEPRHFGAISGLGLIFLKRGDLQGALAAFEAVLAISPASRSAQNGAERVRSELEAREI